MKKFLLSLATAFSFVLFLGSCTNEEDINNNGYSDERKNKMIFGTFKASPLSTSTFLAVASSMRFV
ncbi:hypothetical protein NXW86_30380 (plasmid) [Bacteroides thetaiotaomicron]|nr:hypothetical protein [Bacteroides thetaiotaomicron]MCS2453253.1 hypothetical protein [Bacteroides thetaiotaomicron]